MCVCVCVCVCVASTHLTDVNLSSGGEIMRLDDGRPQSEVVQQQSQTGDAQHHHPRPTWSTQNVTLQRKLDRQVALEGETDDKPDRQEAGHVRHVAEQLAPSRHVVQLQHQRCIVFVILLL